MKYNIIGEPLPVVICDVEPGETLFTESGSMSWMSPNMKMETTSNGGIGKALGRMFAGEHLFMNKYNACLRCGRRNQSLYNHIRQIKLKPSKDNVGLSASSFLTFFHTF